MYEEEGKEGVVDLLREEDSGVVDPITALRGTPHKAHIRAAVGLKPGGLRWLQTSHSQLSNTSAL